MPLSVFIDILHGDVKEPKNWEYLFGKYQRLVSDNSINKVLELIKNITFLDNKIFIIESLCYMLSITYDDNVITELKRYYPQLKFNQNNYLEDVKKIKSLIKTSKIHVIESKKKLDDLQKNTPTSNDLKSDWDAQLAVLSNYLKFNINASDISVARYCHFLEMFKKHIKTHENGK